MKNRFDGSVLTRRGFLKTMSIFSGSTILMGGLTGCDWFEGLYGGKKEEQDQDTVETEEVKISNFSFQPSTIQVKPGTSVNWLQQDNTPHTVTSQKGLFDSGNLSKGESFEFTFENAGTYEYDCTIHPSMTGTVIVEEA